MENVFIQILLPSGKMVQFSYEKEDTLGDVLSSLCAAGTLTGKAVEYDVFLIESNRERPLSQNQILNPAPGLPLKLSVRPCMIPEPSLEPDAPEASDQAEPDNSSTENSGNPTDEAPKKARFSITGGVQDSRVIENRKAFPEISEPYYRSVSPQKLRNDTPRLFLMSEALEVILPFVGWGQDTEANKVEQAGILYGKLCFTNSFLNKQCWGEVYGFIPAVAPDATAASITIPASEWQRMYSALDDLNLQRARDGLEPYVNLGWLHTHPHTLTPFFSSLDVDLQKRMMNNDHLFGVVVNPHKQIFACYADADSKPCRAVMQLNEALNNQYDFQEIEPIGGVYEEDGPVLRLRASHAYRPPMNTSTPHARPESGRVSVDIFTYSINFMTYSLHLTPRQNDGVRISEASYQALLQGYRLLNCSQFETLCGIVTATNSGNGYSFAFSSLMPESQLTKLINYGAIRLGQHDYIVLFVRSGQGSPNAASRADNSYYRFVQNSRSNRFLFVYIDKPTVEFLLPE